MAFPVMAAVQGGGMLLDAIMGSKAQKQQNNIAIQQLYLQREAQRQSTKLAKANRTDAYGNTVGYEEGRGFVTTLTPLQQAIMSGQQGEQLASLREDAPRQRAASVRQDDRSKNADKAFTKLMGEYESLDRPTEKGEQGKSVLRALEDRRGQSSDGGFLNQALRTGVTPQKTGGGKTLTAAIMDAKEQGSSNYLQKDQALVGGKLNEANNMRGIADGTSSTPIDTQTNQAGALGQTADSSLSALMQAIQNGANGQSSALGNMKFESNPIFGKLAGLATGAMDKQQENKMLREQNAQAYKNSDREYALKYYKATGRFPS
jgi:hypothetical protein